MPPRSENSKGLKREILAAATDLFSRKGYHATSTQELAEAVGTINKSTLYYHIHKKESLLYQIHQEVTDEGIHCWSAIASQEGSAVDIIRQMIVEHCRVIDRHRDAVAVFSEEMKYLSPAHRRRVLNRRHEYQELLEKVIARGVERKELRTESPRLTAMSMLGMMNGMYRWYRPGGRLGPNQVGKIFADILLTGLAA